jgi:integrase
LALPVAPLEPERSVPWDAASPSQYDSETARRLVQSWGKWFVRQAPGMQLYDLRHAWAVRSIRVGLNASLAAKCMGHSLAVHHSTYHRWLDESDVAAVAAGLG